MTQLNEIPNLKVVTLNIWGIKYVSKNVQERLDHLIEALNQSDYDIVALQEVWSHDADFVRIKESILKNFKFSHYFHSGLVGSGCCIFSKHSIENVFYHNFSLNGYMHKFHHGDWFAGKLVGLAQVRYHSVLINVYTTHLHANYSKKFHLNEFNDEYLAHRYSQLFELGQYINMTSNSADLIIVAGDLNTREFEHGYKLLRSQSNLLDAFRERQNIYDQESGITCNAISNCYSNNDYPDDQARIDYVLFKNCQPLALQVKCVELKNCLGKIPNNVKNLNYSDHEGVRAVFQINRGDKESQTIVDKIEPNVDYWMSAYKIIEKHYNNILADQCFLAVLALISIFVGLNFDQFLLDFNVFFVYLKNIISAFILFYAALSLLFVKTIEKKNLKRILDSLNLAAYH
jgi:sphingomyelin phosphodiesterase 2